MKKDLLIFDLDGTLIDSGDDIATAANMTLAAMGHEARSIEAIKENIGWGVRMLLEGLMPGEGDDRILEARKKFLSFYGEHLTDETYIYPGVVETLSYFRESGKTMAVVTNKPEGLSRRILDELSLKDFFMMLIGGDTLENRKPHPEPLEKVMAVSGFSPPETAFVGDSPVDSETGTKAGVFTIGVSYGFRDVKELESAGFGIIIDRFSELRALLG
ncbi:MAG: HAD family hydrolase [Thermodesulfobacteriota bacterium]|nr:MAG: HAD family hydrolase [Thermodesulfobacteriota bacterium]